MTIVTKDDKFVSSHLITSQKVADIMKMEHQFILGVISQRMGTLNNIGGNAFYYKETLDSPVSLVYLNTEQTMFLMTLLAEKLL